MLKEKLQKLFNDHIFEEERKIYEAEGLPADVIPPYVVVVFIVKSVHSSVYEILMSF